MIQSIPISIKRIEEDGLHLFIEATVNGRRMEMLIDTGASRSVFDRELIKEYTNKEPVLKDSTSTGLGTSNMEIQTLQIDEISFGQLKLTNYLGTLIDLTHINETYEALGYSKVVGVLGSDLLASLNGVIDYGTLSLKLHK